MSDYVDIGEVALCEAFDNRYARKEHRFGVERVALTHAPVIDVSAFTGPSALDEREAVARKIRKACIDIGFFYITGHGFSKAEIEDANAIAVSFFELPEAAKLTVKASQSKASRGWVQTGGVNPSQSTEKTPDVKERFFISNKAGGTGGLDDSHNQWPSEAIAPGFETFMRAHIAKRMTLTRQMVHAFALSLGLPEDYLDAMFTTPGVTLALNYYPAIDAEKLARTQWSFSPHTDYGSFTLLTQDSVGGLQARNCEGEWIDIPPIEGTFVVNIGDTMARWTNDLYASNLHRAMNTSGKARISAAFFTMPNAETLVECLPTCWGPNNPARYEPINAAEYNAALVRQSHATGRPGISRSTARRLAPS